jgi:hypothetical protein
MTSLRWALVLFVALLAGWLVHGLCTSSCPTEPAADVELANPLHSQAAWRCVHAEPGHWRACLLQH